MKFFIKSFGCQYNEWDASRLSFVLKSLGFTESEKDEADIVFLLNCSVRKTGVDRAMSFTKNFIKSGKKVFISGCILESDRKIFAEKGAEIWDNENIDKLKKFLSLDDNKALSFARLFEEGQKVSNYIPITKGCNNFCSYCAVPYTRGREISRPADEIIENVKKVISAGHKEIWLLGQNVNSYRSQQSTVNSSQLDVISSEVERSSESKKISPPVLQSRNDKSYGFAQLLKEINDISGDFKIYFTSNHPKDMSNEIIEAIATLSKVAKSIHLPLQSGSNKILKAMNRPYTAEDYLRLVKSIKSKVPGVQLTTDTIVGFPGETEEDFQETVEVLNKVKFVQVYNNKYSPRSGTKAFALGDPIPWAEKERRWRILNELTNR